MMRCFIPCFGSSKSKPSKLILHSSNIHAADGALDSAERANAQKPLYYDHKESKTNVEEQSNSSVRKKVMFDSNANVNKELSIKDLFNKLEESNTRQEKQLSKKSDCADATALGPPPENEKKGEDEKEDEINPKFLPEESSGSLFSLSIDSRTQVFAERNADNEVDSSMPVSVTFCSEKEKSDDTLKEHAEENTNSFIIGLEEQSKCIDEKEFIFDLNENSNQVKEKTIEISDSARSISSFWSSDPTNYRYQDCHEEGHEDESDLGDTFVDPENEKIDNGTLFLEESSESLFSVSIESGKQVSASEKEVNSPMPVHGEVIPIEEETENSHTSSVLNPIENLDQGKVVKTTVKQPLKYEAKENINLLGADTILSSWLVEDEAKNTPKSKNSTSSVANVPSMSHEDRPILGALTMEDLRQFCGSTSPASRRLKCPSSDETPIIGTVGSYWIHTGKTINSDSSTSCGRMSNSGIKSREATKGKWKSTPLKSRLDRAFDDGIP